ncbi:DUF2075 domain-containing protein [Undibacterium sp. Jales W-56]|uniref:DUF2075 domain-containing protein n=1 Tax=Undibacterium sp. Jales W-56 TaxID=2897325 RepID=UPI0021D0056C|nr:DUF2075 domain-containing protein [Undibacterium sp. Jales W-56]MCU6434202.1 DUF2075 domain-containing protein [Undibacterium sp. Jales W-56]
MSRRALYGADVPVFLLDTPENIAGALSLNLGPSATQEQKSAWIEQAKILHEVLVDFTDGYILFEVLIPRMGRRVDAVLIVKNILFVLEFKIGAKVYFPQDLRQAHGYALDLHHFHEGSHNKCIVPILIATQAASKALPNVASTPQQDDVHAPLRANRSNLTELLRHCLQEIPQAPAINLQHWLNSSYKPTPTIIEAAQALYANHDVSDIARNDARENLYITSNALQDIIHQARLHHRKTICFVTGVPGAGKTLIGLNIATSMDLNSDEKAVFLSGNDPLVLVLREALARDAKTRGSKRSKEIELKSAEAVIQNIHKFRDTYVEHKDAPPERVVIFDEAQRAWDAENTSKFMSTKRGQSGFSQSEPEFLISVMDRHSDWCVIVALIGGGQEINTGEAGLQGWVDALAKQFADWDVHYSDKLTQIEYAGRDVSFNAIAFASAQASLHLATSMRSFRAEKLSHMVHYLIHNQPTKAQACYQEFKHNFPIKITRDLARAKAWIKAQARANETKGMIASSGAIRLKAEGIFVKNRLTTADWFLNSQDDIRSCHFLEDVATEFDIQGLELDWCLVGWDADYRYQKTHSKQDGQFEHWKFTGTNWKRRLQEEQQRYLENAYRVLLTRARQGMVIFVPQGEAEDATRLPEYLNGTFEYLVGCGVEVLA